ncbi:MAG: Re/Si-specific NAD(P)(+) transhydrogenase subunit alpha [Chromatiales bacterium]|nr:Re/Si-specific NAD(P)(+) transhydrogenase subunit alpha [Chromatiales bacterium]
MKIAILKEIQDGESRVAASPDSINHFIKLGYEVVVEKGAGVAADFSDAAYREAGAEISDDSKSLWQHSDIILKVKGPTQQEAELLTEHSILICFIWPAQNKELVDKLKHKGSTVLAMDQVPRITRAQKLDALSSMANIAGYRAVVEASNHFTRFFGGQSTAAGRAAPAKVLVIGAGVAGLAAIGAARSMGAIVRAFDTRPEVAQQIESMGAEFLTIDMEELGSGSGGYAKQMSDAFLEAERALFLEQAKEVDIIISTALIPGKPAPRLISVDAVKALKAGSVVVDLAAEQGGNCELTEMDKAVVKQGVTIIGYSNLPSRMASQSSRFYAANLQHLLTDMTPEKDGNLAINLDDQVVRGMIITHKKEVLWPPPASAQPPPKPQVKQAEAVVEQTVAEPPRKRLFKTLLFSAIGLGSLLALGQVAPASFMTHFTVFVLACFVGWQVIWNVTPALHTPLMSVTNAISGIIIIGALVQTVSSTSVVLWLAIIAVLVAMINVAGGFLVTYRMLNMFRKS